MKSTSLTIHGRTRWSLRRLNYELYLAQYGLSAQLARGSGLRAVVVVVELAALWLVYWLLLSVLLVAWVVTLPVEAAGRLVRWIRDRVSGPANSIQMCLLR